jgi:MFS superfamily sulfate permease-like transporter
MLSSTFWPVFRFTSVGGGGGSVYFCRFHLTVEITVITDITTNYKHIHTMTVEWHKFLNKNNSAMIRLIFALLNVASTAVV